MYSLDELNSMMPGDWCHTVYGSYLLHMPNVCTIILSPKGWTCMDLTGTMTNLSLDQVKKFYKQYFKFNNFT